MNCRAGKNRAVILNTTQAALFRANGKICLIEQRLSTAVVLQPFVYHASVR